MTTPEEKQTRSTPGKLRLLPLAATFPPTSPPRPYAAWCPRFSVSSFRKYLISSTFFAVPRRIFTRLPGVSIQLLPANLQSGPHIHLHSRPVRLSFRQSTFSPQVTAITHSNLPLGQGSPNHQEASLQKNTLRRPTPLRAENRVPQFATSFREANVSTGATMSRRRWERNRTSLLGKLTCGRVGNPIPPIPANPTIQRPYTANPIYSL